MTQDKKIRRDIGKVLKYRYGVQRYWFKKRPNRPLPYWVFIVQHPTGELERWTMGPDPIGHGWSVYVMEPLGDLEALAYATRKNPLEANTSAHAWYLLQSAFKHVELLKEEGQVAPKGDCTVAYQFIVRHPTTGHIERAQVHICPTHWTWQFIPIGQLEALSLLTKENPRRWRRR